MSQLDVAVIGASGYSGEDLCRLLTHHPKVKLRALTSRQLAGKTLSESIPGLKGHPSLKFENLSPDDIKSRAEVFFLALPHGVAAEYAVPLRKEGKTVIDLSADFRLKDPAVYKDFYGQDHPAPDLLKESIYALPELHRAKIPKANLLACPGCYPTSILLALAPAVSMGLIDPKTISIFSMSGVSGAGKKAEEAYMYCEVNENARAYGVPKHRHLSEIEEQLSIMAETPVKVTFVPHLVPLTRGMHTTISAQLTRNLTWAEAQGAYESFYQREPFIHIKPKGALPEIKHVARTNSAEIALRIDDRTGRFLAFSAIDNLGKGAASQAIQAMNVRFGFAEELGLPI